jgi:hypothetical protein
MALHSGAHQVRRRCESWGGKRQDLTPSALERALEPDSMPNMLMVLVLYTVSAMKLRANDIVLFFFEFRNECERIGRYRH